MNHESTVWHLDYFNPQLKYESANIYFILHLTYYFKYTFISLFTCMNIQKRKDKSQKLVIQKHYHIRKYYHLNQVDVVFVLIWLILVRIYIWLYKCIFLKNYYIKVRVKAVISYWQNQVYMFNISTY